MPKIALDSSEIAQARAGSTRIQLALVALHGLVERVNMRHPLLLQNAEIDLAAGLCRRWSNTDAGWHRDQKEQAGNNGERCAGRSGYGPGSVAKQNAVSHTVFQSPYSNCHIPIAAFRLPPVEFDPRLRSPTFREGGFNVTHTKDAAVPARLWAGFSLCRLRKRAAATRQGRAPVRVRLWPDCRVNAAISCRTIRFGCDNHKLNARMTRALPSAARIACSCLRSYG